MRLEDLEGLTTLPVDDLRSRLRQDEIVTVLPVTGDRPRRDHVLVATARRLAIATQRRQPCGRRRLTVRWVPWTSVTLGAAGLGERVSEGHFDLVVRVGQRSYRALLEGPAGQSALREFVVASQGALKPYAA